MYIYVVFICMYVHMYTYVYINMYIHLRIVGTLCAANTELISAYFPREFLKMAFQRES